MSDTISRFPPQLRCVPGGAAGGTPPAASPTPAGGDTFCGAAAHAQTKHYAYTGAGQTPDFETTLAIVAAGRAEGRVRAMARHMHALPEAERSTLMPELRAMQQKAYAAFTLARRLEQRETHINAFLATFGQPDMKKAQAQ